jgi:hypothetical protein
LNYKDILDCVNQGNRKEHSTPTTSGYTKKGAYKYHDALSILLKHYRCNFFIHPIYKQCQLELKKKVH